MNRLEALEDTTMELYRLLQQEWKEANRDEVIEKVESLLNRRHEQLKDVTPPYTDKEKEIGKKLLPMNEEIQTKLNKLFQQIKQDIKSIKKQKHSNQKYTNPYQNLSNFDGMFLDHKK